MRLLPWLANRGKPAMSPHAEGKKGTRHTDIVYTVEKRGRVGGNNPKTVLKHRMAPQQTEGIHAHVGNGRPLTAQVYQCWLHACTGVCARTNNTKCKGAQTPAACTGACASQNTVGHEGTLTWVNALAHEPNKSTDP